ncbi:MAG: lysophospholipid acyltransferase family protein [Candidatus Eisenbacteria bacterium]|nr:lysophospholipid acyltransferase family protein [Candidatus Eisenbacteria bacterium]
MKRMKGLRRAVRFGLIRALLWPLEILPRGWALRLGGVYGTLAWRCGKALRESIDRNLRLIQPGFVDDRARFGRVCLRALGRNAVDFLRMARLDRAALERLIRVVGEEHLEGALARGRGVVVATGHVGCWELMAAYYARRGYPVHVLARPLREAWAESFVTGRRTAAGVRTLSRNSELMGAARALRRGGMVGILFDQDMKAEGVRVPFFGRLAFTPVGPAALCRMTRAALLPMAIQSEGDGSHKITILPEVEVRRTDDREGDLYEMMVALSGSLERLIEQRPEQWVWFHDRWRRSEEARDESTVVENRDEESARGAWDPPARPSRSVRVLDSAGGAGRPERGGLGAGPDVPEPGAS